MKRTLLKLIAGFVLGAAVDVALHTFAWWAWLLIGSVVLGSLGAVLFLWMLARGIERELFGPDRPDAEGQSAIDGVFA